ncbi:MAG: class I SAM-dependent RNA methyltransferase [Litoreibacter sp.]
MTTTDVVRLNLKGYGLDAEDRVFERTLPGETVDLDGRILTPSAMRVKAPCRHFKACGGCTLQHASDDFVANWKTDVILNGLSARGIETEVRPILTSPKNTRRRAVLHGKRTKKGVMIGFHAAGSDTLVDVPDCQLLDPALMAGMPAYEALTLFAASRKSEVSLVVTSSHAGLDIDVRGGKPIEDQELFMLAKLADTHDLARLTWEGETIATRRPPVQSFGGTQVAPPPGAFLQATRHGQEALTDCVNEVVNTAKSVVDLFAGCGTFSLPAARTSEVWALEGENASIDALDAGWRMAEGLKRIRSETRDLFRRPVMAEELRKVDVAIIDPPRAGAEAQTTELAQSKVPKIAAISCNPVTFARDAAILQAGGYVLDWVQPVDQFRWSAHVELAASFTKRR